MNLTTTQNSSLSQQLPPNNASTDHTPTMELIQTLYLAQIFLLAPYAKLHNGLVFILCIKCKVHESMDLCLSFTEETCGPRTVPDRRRESNETFSPLKVNTSRYTCMEKRRKGSERCKLCNGPAESRVALPFDI